MTRQLAARLAQAVQATQAALSEIPLAAMLAGQRLFLALMLIPVPIPITGLTIILITLTIMVTARRTAVKICTVKTLVPDTNRINLQRS